tara:strand:+ start:583 stop:921 length:339 start_codon:yes stop_codon:yes gene_type:complete
MSELISSTSYMRKKIEDLRDQKKLARDVEAALVKKRAEDAAEKKQKSDARIAAKLARLSGVEAPAVKEPAVKEPALEPVKAQEDVVAEEAPVIKKAPRKAAAKKPIEQTEEE